MGLLLVVFVLFGNNTTTDDLLQVRVRDFITGYGVNASIQVFLNELNITRSYTDELGNFQLDLTPTKYEFLISAEGYEQIQTSLTVGKDKIREILVHLSPLDAKRPELDHSKIEIEGLVAILHGFIVDKAAGRPLENVRIMAQSANVTAMSNRSGYFCLVLPAQDLLPNAAPPRETFYFTKPDYKAVEMERYVIAGESYLNVALECGAGSERILEEQGLFNDKNRDLEKGKGYDCPSCKREHYVPDTASILAVYLDPPPIIRVGTNCTGYSCTDVEIMTLEAYVQSGIDDEWIASWHYHSLRAGSLPYRSYGAWYVYHPVDPDYDITNNTYCQVWQPDQYQSCIDAATYTSGIMVEYSSAVARSEYSAENNDCGCGDGQSGTGSSWPCISDAPCAGQACYGHGRGMCQWGSQRWANSNGANWYWISNHYYNPGAYYPSTPMYITSAAATPETVAVLDTFTINLNTYNGAEHNHWNIMIGASLYLDGNYISDPSHDNKVTVNAGNDAESRIFVVPAGTADGTYDLLVALWFDVDENNVINAGDFPLYTITLYDEVVVGSFPAVQEPVTRIPHYCYSLAVSPNPAKSEDVVVTYSLPRAEMVTVRLLDVLGREVFKRIKHCEQGRNTMPVKAGDLAPAVYFVQLETERQNLIKKIVILE